MIKIETHCHSLGASVCAKATNEQIVKNYIKNGYGGLILTNHYSEGAFSTFPEGDDKVKAEYFMGLMDGLKEYAKPFGLKIFTGIEVRSKVDDQEYMIIGFDNDFLIENADLYKKNQKELFELANKHGLYMGQTHPFRSSGKHLVVCGDPRYLHGAEAFNGHFHHVNNNQKAKEFCKGNNLIQLSGSDYHDQTQPIIGGILVPDSVCTDSQLVQCLFDKKHIIIEDEIRYVYEREEYFKRKK